MRNRTLADLDRVVALGGGHGLGRVLSSLSSLGSRLTGIVTTPITVARRGVFAAQKAVLPGAICVTASTS